MTRQLLPGQRVQVPAQARPRTPAGAPAPQQPRPAPAARLRRPAVLALVAGATVVLAALGWVLVHSPQEVADERTSVLLRPRTPAAASPTASPSATPTGDISTGAGVPGGRDPFGGTPAAPAGVTTAPTSAPGAPPPATTVTTTVTAAPADPGVTATATTTVTSTVTRTSTPTVTPSVTMTAPGSAVYVGFYAWNGNRAAFRINARAYTRGVGATFGPQVTFTGIVPGTPRCTRLTYQGGRPFTLCPGQVVKLP